MRCVLKNISIVLLSLYFGAAFAWDGSVEGRIDVFEVTGGNSYDFRVWLSNGPPMCGNQTRFAYLNETDANYKTYVAVLLSAHRAQTLVRIHTTRDSSGNCKIGHVLAYSY